MNELAELREQIEIKDEVIKQLREQIGLDAEQDFLVRCRERFGMKRQCALALHVLLVRHHVSREQLFMAVSRDPENKDISLAGVIICQLRKYVAKHGIEIKTAWGTGYYMTDEMRARVWQMIGMGEQ